MGFRICYEIYGQKWPWEKSSFMIIDSIEETLNECPWKYRNCNMQHEIEDPEGEKFKELIVSEALVTLTPISGFWN